MKIRAIDLFCGAGGGSWGAQTSGVEIVAGFDRWRLAAKTHKANFPGSTFFLGRLENKSPRKLKERLGNIDLILASPECTNHSPAKGNKPRCDISRDTAFQVIRFAKVLKPRWIIIENVVSMRRWSRYAEFKAQLEKLGYNIREQVLNAMNFGVPQSRRRLFLLCDGKQMPAKLAIADKTTPLNARSIVNLNGKYSYAHLYAKRRAKPTLLRARRALRAIGKSKPFLLVYYGSDAAGGWQTLDRPLRTITTVDRFALVKPEGHRSRLMRMLQVPELQRAMGMSGMALSLGSRRERIKMLGNAVCPPVMAAVVRHLTASGI